jgi:hypothetical protein
MSTTQMSEEVKAFLKALSKLSALYENHPELPVPALGDIYAFPETREELAAATRKIAHLKPKKEATEYDSFFRVVVELSPLTKLHFCVERAKVCERVLVGTELVEVPAQPAVEAHVEERPKYEWKCADAILAPGVGK